MSRYEWLLFAHLVGAFLSAGGGVVAAVFYSAAARRRRPSEVALLLLGPLVGFFGHGYFSVFGAMLAELFPSAIRGAARAPSFAASTG